MLDILLGALIVGVAVAGGLYYIGRQLKKPSNEAPQKNEPHVEEIKVETSKKRVSPEIEINKRKINIKDVTAKITPIKIREKK